MSIVPIITFKAGICEADVSDLLGFYASDPGSLT